MSAGPVRNSSSAYVQASDPSLGQTLRDDAARRRIKAELLDLGGELVKNSKNALQDDPRIKSIAIWQKNFLNSLRHPDVYLVIRKYINLLIEILQDPPDENGIIPPFSIELFTDRPMPIIQYIVAKMRDSRSLFYSEEFDREAERLIADANFEEGQEERGYQVRGESSTAGEDIPPRVFAQLRRIRANIAYQRQTEVKQRADIQALVNRVKQREAQFHERVSSVARDNLEAGRRLEERIEQSAEKDARQRAFLKEMAEKLNLESEKLEAEIKTLQNELDRNKATLSELEKANQQLKIDINEVRKEANKNKSNWLVSIACIAISAGLSYATGMPIVIIPPGN